MKIIFLLKMLLIPAYMAGIFREFSANLCCADANIHEFNMPAQNVTDTTRVSDANSGNIFVASDNGENSNVMIPKGHANGICQFERSKIDANNSKTWQTRLFIYVYGMRPADTYVLSIIAQKRKLISKTINYESCKLWQYDDQHCSEYIEGSEAYLMLRLMVILKSACRSARCDTQPPITTLLSVQRPDNGSLSDLLSAICYDISADTSETIDIMGNNASVDIADAKKAPSAGAGAATPQSTTHDSGQAQPAGPVLTCQIRLLHRALRPTDGRANSTDHWFALFSAVGLPTERDYTLLLSSGAGVVLTRNLHRGDGEAYEEGGVPRLMFTGQLDFHRTFLPSSEEPPRPLLTLAVLPLPRDGGLQTWEPPTPQLCEVVWAQYHEEPSPAAEYRLEVLSPAGGVDLESGPIHVHYRLYPADPTTDCEAVEVTVTAMVDGVLRAQAPAVCGKEDTITISRVQRGQRALSLVATDATGRKLAEAGLIVQHPGPHPQEDPNAMCLLSYPHSGNHLTRFLIEYLTGRPTAGCFRSLTDVPIHTNTFPVPGPGPLVHVDPLERPAAFKFHYAASCGTMCALADVDRGAAFGTACSRLVLVVRDFAKCIPRYFEGVSSPAAVKHVTTPLLDEVDVQISLYMGNLGAFSNFTGPKLLLHYEDLISGPEAARLLAVFLGDEVDPSRMAALVADYHVLSDLSRRAGGRDWLGTRQPEAGGYLDKWQTKAVCRLAELFKEARQKATGEALAALESYITTEDMLLVSCSKSEVANNVHSRLRPRSRFAAL